jgi:hypothetical protein
MFKKTTLTFLALMGILAFAALAKRSHREFSEARPLSKTELLALVAGGSLPENITWHWNWHPAGELASFNSVLSYVIFLPVASGVLFLARRMETRLRKPKSNS